MYWLFNRDINPTLDWIRQKFSKKPELAKANELALKAGYNYGEHNEIFTTRFEIKPAQLPKGVYRNVAGNEATALGFVAASLLSDIPLFLGSYPITPASEIMQYLSNYKNYGVKTLQAEDEIAGIASAIGAAYGGNLAITTTSGPGLALKTEAMGLAVMTELPLVIVDVQRGGPSTGLPTKTEQSDLLQAIFGRNGESPIPVIAASSPSDCFYTAIEASRIALKYMTPVLMLTDGYIANGAEPWKLPNIEDLPKLQTKLRTDPEGFMPYLRDEDLARPWAVPGTPGLEHRIGGLEKANITGTVSYDPDNHDLMCKLRDKKIKGIQKDIPNIEVKGDEDADIIVVGWGGTYGAISEAVRRVRAGGVKVAQIHIKYLNPFPANLGDILRKYKHILIPEINLGQLAKVIKSEYSVKVIQFNLMRGLPFKAHDIENKIREILGGENGK
jgi:2-oxoglutarate ferredoxin oxidoreductase subunit alpha